MLIFTTDDGAIDCACAACERGPKSGLAGIDETPASPFPPPDTDSFSAAICSNSRAISIL